MFTLVEVLMQHFYVYFSTSSIPTSTTAYRSDNPAGLLLIFVPLSARSDAHSTITERAHSAAAARP